MEPKEDSEKGEDSRMRVRGEERVSGVRGCWGDIFQPVSKNFLG